MSPSHLSEVLEDVVDEDLLGLVGMHSGERVHVDDSVLKANQWKAQGAFQSLQGKIYFKPQTYCCCFKILCLMLF